MQQDSAEVHEQQSLTNVDNSSEELRNNVPIAASPSNAPSISTATSAGDQQVPRRQFPKVVPFAWSDQEQISKPSIFTFPIQQTTGEPVALSTDNSTVKEEPNETVGNRRRFYKSALASRSRHRKSVIEAVGSADEQGGKECEEYDDVPQKHVTFAPLPQMTSRQSAFQIPPVPAVSWQVVAWVGKLLERICRPTVHQLASLLRNRLHRNQSTIAAPALAAPIQLEQAASSPPNPVIAVTSPTPVREPTLLPNADPGHCVTEPGDAHVKRSTVTKMIDIKCTEGQSSCAQAIRPVANALPAPSQQTSGDAKHIIAVKELGLSANSVGGEQVATAVNPISDEIHDTSLTSATPIVNITPSAGATACPDAKLTLSTQDSPAPMPALQTMVPSASQTKAESDVQPLKRLNDPSGPASSRLESSRFESYCSSTASAMTTALKLEKRLRPPSEIPELGLLEFLQLGSFSNALSVAYDVLLFRRNISPVCYELSSSPAISARSCSIFAREALAFNTSTRQVTFGHADVNKPSVICCVDSGIVEIFHALRINATLLQLSIDNMAARDKTMYAFAAMIQVNSTLTSLSLQQNQLTASGIQVLCEALASSPDSMLIELNLSHNSIQDNGAEYICSMLQVNESITCLDVSYNQLSSNAVMKLLSALRENFVLRTLAVYGKDRHPDHHIDNIDIVDGKPIGLALQVLPCLAELTVSSAEAVIPIDKAKDSRWIQLVGCSLQQVDALVLSELLPLNGKLLTLDLSNNTGIRRGGILQILRAMSNCATLKKAVLVNTGLYEESAVEIADVVAANETLEELILHEQIIPVQQLRGQRERYQIESAEFVVADDHFLDRWVLAKCLELNRFTRKFNGLTIEENLELIGTHAAGAATPPNGVTTLKTNSFTPTAKGAKTRKRKDHLVNFSGRQLEVFEVVFLSVRIYHHRSIQGVTMHGCGVESYGATHLADAVRNHATLTSVELENNAIGPIGGKALAECVEYNQSLTSLNLSWNRLGDDGVARFETALVANHTLKVLDLRGNQITFVGIKAISNGLARNWALRVLNLRWNNVCAKAAIELAIALSHNKRLRILDIEHHNIHEEGAVAIAEMLEVNEQLEEINMKGNDTIALGEAEGVGPVAADKLSKALMHKNRTLINLNLAQTQLTRDGLVSFSNVLRVNTTLKVLDLSRSEMDGTTAVIFFHCLSQNKSLEKLNLANNRISNEGMVACVKALEQHQRLRDLNVAGNRITDEPLSILARKFHERAITATLTWLCVAENVMSKATKLQFLQLAPGVIVELDREEGDEEEATGSSS